MNIYKVLVVEDDPERRAQYAARCGGQIELMMAETIEKAEELFAANPDLAAIVMDACVPGDEPTTVPLVGKFRKTFTGPIIAASSEPDFRRELMRAGCSHESPKYELPEKLREVLGL